MFIPVMFGTPGWQEILLILLIVLVLFGAKKLPELARSLGKSLGEFKKGKAEGEKDGPAPAEAPDEDGKKQE